MDQYKFNWTISYKIESEASVGAYGFIGRRTKEVYYYNYSMFDKKLRNNFENREGQAIWFVSNCQSFFRNMFVVKLATHSKVNKNT